MLSFFCQHARQKPLPVDFQRQYATVIIELDDINKVCVLYPVRSAVRKSIVYNSIWNLQLHLLEFHYSG